MSDTTLNRFIASGTNAQRLAFVPAPAAPASGPNPSVVWLETDTGDTYMWNYSGAVWAKVNTASGGSGGSNYKGYQPLALHTTGTAFSSGNWGGVGVVMDEACTLNNVLFSATAAAATATVQAAIYADDGSKPSTRLATSAVITGVTKGLNILPLSAGLVVTQGTFYWIGMVVEVASIAIANNQGIAAAFFATAGPAPAPAPASTFGTHPEIAVWASK